MKNTDGIPVESRWPRRDVLQAGALGVSEGAEGGVCRAAIWSGSLVLLAARSVGGGAPDALV